MMTAHPETDDAAGHKLTLDLQLALQLTGAVLYQWSADTSVMRWASPQQAQRLLGLEAPYAETSVEDFHALLPQTHRLRRERLLAQGPGVPTMRLEYPVSTHEGTTLWLEERVTWVDGAVMVGVLRSLQDQKRRERAYAASAIQDDLTGLLTRPRLQEAMEHGLARAVRRSEPMVYAAFAIDDLSTLNLKFGFDVADQVIASIGRRIENAARGFDVAGRIAGNKFGFLLAATAADRAEGAVRRIMEAVGSDVVDTAIGPVEVTLSCGCVSIRPGESESRQIMIRAEAALDMAKQAGPGSLLLIDYEANAESPRLRHAELARTLVSALDDDRLVLAFQPIADAQTGTLMRLESLARLQDLSGEIVPGAGFIEVAETTGLVRRVDMRVLRKAALVLEERSDLALSVNVSGATVRNPAAARAYLGALNDYAAIAPRLTIELTETCLVEAQDVVVSFVDGVRKAGARFSVDDFGAGYTSFRQLQDLEPDEVKIDGAFVRGISQDPRQASFVEALVRLARALNVSVIAEFVGDQADADILETLGVTAVQGSLFGMPSVDLPAAA